METQLKQVLREANLSDGPRAATTIDATANGIMGLVEGRLSQYVRSDFTRRPTEYSDEQWKVLRAGLFR